MIETKKTAIPVIIDCDPGADDFFALIWTLVMHKKGFINVVAITTSGGNVPAQSTYENALRACEMMGVETIVSKGYDKAGAESAAHIHGNDGIGGLSKYLPIKKKYKAYKSDEVLLQMIEKYKGNLEILATGPLSNLAMIEKKKKGVLKDVKRIISMGGAFFIPGNVTPVSEFNYWYDPESVDVVLKSGANLALAPLDLTTKQVFRVEDLNPVLEHINHEVHRKFLYELTKFTIGTNMGFRETHYQKGFFVHDANTIGFLLYPQIYSGTFYQVNIETMSPLTKGMTVVDGRNSPRTNANVFVILDMKKDWFLEAMTEDFKDFDFSLKPKSKKPVKKVMPKKIAKPMKTTKPMKSKSPISKTKPKKK